MLDNGYVYFLMNGDKGISILKYSLNNKRVEDQPQFTKIVNLNDLSNYKVFNGKLYAFTINNKNPNKSNKEFIIADLSNGQIIYEGKINVKNGKEKSTKNLQVFDFKIE